MTDPPRRFWRWPGGRHVGRFLALAAAVGAWFVLVYGGADWLASRHAWRVRVHLDAERTVPFVPAAVVGYAALYPLFLLAPFVLHTAGELRSLARTLAVVIAVAGVGFVLVPAEAAFPPTPACGAWDGAVRLAKRLALTNNYLPSLHVALAVVCVAVYGRHAGAVGRAALVLWGGAVAASTLLLHQHYVIDVVAGALLGLAGVRWVHGARCAA